MKKQYVRPLMILAIAGLWLTTPDSLYAQVKNFKKVDAEKQPLDCNVPPIIHCPETFEACPGASTDPKTTGFPEAFPGNAACGTPLLSFSDRVVQSGTCPGAQLVQRVWTAQDPDNPNLRAFCIQYINTLDTTPPRFLNCPRDTAILSNSECTATFRWTMPWITDECGSFCSTSSHPNGGSFTIGLHTIIITATDACGNSSTCQFTLEVIENCCVQPPVITCPADYITCPGKSIAPEVSGKPEVQKATPACHEPKLSYSDKILNTSSCNMLIERTWTAVDPDNPALFASCIQLIHMEDKTPPVITFCPRDITVASNDDCFAIVNWDRPRGEDACGDVRFTVSVLSGSKFQIGTTTVLVTAKDPCGNESTCSFNVTVEANCCNLPPEIICPADFLGCPNVKALPEITGRAEAKPGSPKCDQPLLKFEDDTLKHRDCLTEINRVWIAVDPNDPHLVSRCVQKIILEDKTPPVITFCPPNITVASGIDCAAEVNWKEPTATDDCGPVKITTSVPSGYKFQLGLAAVVVIATDACGNTSKCEFLVTVEDHCCKSIPQIQCPAEFIGCPSSSREPSVTGTAVASPGDSSCPQPILSFRDSTIHHTDCFTEIYRIWTARDPHRAHLESHCTQRILLEDRTPPVITFCPPNITVQSDDDCTAKVTWPEPKATDNCGTVRITTSIPSGYQFQLGRAAVVVIATDACGNTSKCEFLITVEENCCKSEPVIHCPADVYSCPGSSIDTSVTGQATAAPGDPKCGQPSLRFEDQLVRQSDCHTEINRIWIATDPNHAELKSRCIQKIILRDTTAPVFTSCPSNIIVTSNADCTAEVQWSAPRATDDCSQVTIVSSVPSGSVFQLGLTIVRVTATDACGNLAICEFEVNVEENCCNDAPEISCPPNFTACPKTSLDTSITGTAHVAAYPGPCKPAELTFRDSIVNADSCHFLVHRIWTATNPKNNLSRSCTQIILLEDQVKPDLQNCPADITVDSDDNCKAKVSWTPPTASDGCGIPDISFTHKPGDEFNVGVTRVVYAAVDACGNFSSCVFFVTVNDNCCNNNPILNCPPDFRGCPGLGLNPAVTGTATASPAKPACEQPILTYSDVVISDGPCAGAIVVERTWIATDPKKPELRTTCKQRIELSDREPPVILNLPGDITVDANGHCDAEAFWLEPEAMDNCKLLSLTSNYKPGDRFEKGATTIIYTATDHCGLVRLDSFRIHVTGTDIGVVCPADTTVIRTDPFMNGAIVLWNPPQVNYCEPCVDFIPGFIYMGEWEGHRYFCSLGPANWTNARLTCERIGGRLAVINSASENAFVSSKLNGQTAWIGATDQRIEGLFEWLDGAPFTFRSWAPGQPNNGKGDEDFIEMLPDGSWNDQHGSVEREYICEIPCYDLKQIGGPLRGEMVPCGNNKITYVATKSGISDTCSFTVTVDCDKETIYCKAKALNSSYMYIDRVQFAGIDTITGNNGGYHYFNTACGSVRSGQTYSLCVTPGYPGSTYKVYWKIWIDYNADGFFDPLTEEAVYGYGTTVMCANITMPAYLPSRLTRMRIIQSYTGYPPNPCHSPLYGEVEDYCISLNGGTVFGPEAGRSAISATPSALRVPVDGVLHTDETPVKGLDEQAHNGWSTPFDVDIFPNPTSSEVSIKALFGAIAELQIYNSQGKMVWQNGTHSVSPNLQLEVSNWSDGIYTVVLRSSDNQQIIRRFVVHR